MEDDQRPGTQRNNEENAGRNFSPGTWGRKGKRRKGGPRFAGSGRGLVRLGNVANYGLTSADFGVPSSVSRNEGDDR